MTMPHARPRAKMTRHQSDRLPAVIDALIIFFQQIRSDGALVVRLGKIGIDFNRPAEMLYRLLHLPVVEGLGPLADLMVGRAASGTKPDRPERMLGHLIHHRIGVFELVRQFDDARLASHQRQRQRRHLAGIRMVAEQQRHQLVLTPMRFEMSHQSVQVLVLQVRLHRLDKLDGIHPCHAKTVGVRCPNVYFYMGKVSKMIQY